MKNKVYATDTARLPDFLIAGAARSGTSSLYYYLNQHSQIYLPEHKECWFFTFANQETGRDPIFSRIKLITSRADYSAQFVNAKSGQVMGECSTIYLHLWKQTIQNIHAIYTGRVLPKIIIVLRNPIERAYSHYRFDFMERFVTNSFTEAIASCKAGEGAGSIYNNYLTYGLYYEQVKAYMDTFPDVFVFLSERLALDPGRLMKDLFNFLEIKTDEPINTNFRANVSGIPKQNWVMTILQRDNFIKASIKALLPEMKWQILRTRLLNKVVRHDSIESSTTQFLKEYYHHDILKLEHLLGVKLLTWSS